ILLLSAVNCLTVAFGGKVQSALTILKVAGIAFVVGGVFFFSETATWSNLAAPAGATQTGGFALLSAVGVAVLAALWPYDGWNNMPMAAGGGAKPGGQIPLVFIVG